MSDLSAVGCLDYCDSTPSSRSLSDLEHSYHHLNPTRVAERRAAVIKSSQNAAGSHAPFRSDVTASGSAQDRKREKENDSMVDLGIQSGRDLGTKSAKKRSSLGLNFNIQLFKGARERFNKKKNPQIVQQSKENREFLGKMGAPNRSKGHEEFSDLFPHLLRAPPSAALGPLPPSKYSPDEGRFTPIYEVGRQKWKGKMRDESGKETQKTNLENGDENMELENGNWWSGERTEVKMRKNILNRKNTILLDDWRRSFEENDATDCFCHFTNQNRKWFRKKKPINSRCKSDGWHSSR